MDHASGDQAGRGGHGHRRRRRKRRFRGWDGAWLRDPKVLLRLARAGVAVSGFLFARLITGGH